MKKERGFYIWFSVLIVVILVVSTSLALWITRLPGDQGREAYEQCTASFENCYAQCQTYDCARPCINDRQDCERAVIKDYYQVKVTP